MVRNGNWAEVACAGLLGCAALGAAGGCAAMEDLDTAGADQAAALGEAEQGLASETTEAVEARLVKRYVPDGVPLPARWGVVVQNLEQCRLAHGVRCPQPVSHRTDHLSANMPRLMPQSSTSVVRRGRNTSEPC